MTALTKLISAISRGLAILAGIATFLVMMLVVVDVTLRFLGGGVPGTLEIVTYYLMLVVAFLALGRVEQNNGMITVDALYDNLASPGRRWVMALSTLVSALVYGGLAYASMEEALKQYGIGAYAMTLTFKLVIWPAYFIVPLAFATATVVAALRCTAALLGQRVPAAVAIDLGLGDLRRRSLGQDDTTGTGGQ